MQNKLMTVAALLGLSISGLQAASAKDCAPKMQDGWVRLGPSAMPMMAGFGRIVNACNKPVEIVSASSEAFGEVSIHETRTVDGVSRMRELDALRVDTGASAELKPGGLHLMLMRPKQALQEGAKVLIDFKLSDGRQMRSELTVRKPAP